MCMQHIQLAWEIDMIALVTARIPEPSDQSRSAVASSLASTSSLLALDLDAVLAPTDPTLSVPLPLVRLDWLRTLAPVG